jgi:predicted metal-dependent HD superfamily phosphohydrolase
MNLSRFIQLWQRNVSGNGAWNADKVGAYLRECYTEKFRCYHDETHIDECLKWFDRYQHTITDPDSVELAIWFHDACYGTDSVEYEKLSAELFQQMSAGGISDERQNKIYQLILDTTHREAPQSLEGALMVDIDLASFARPWHDYLKDTAQCRAERTTQTKREFNTKQINFLLSLLSRPSVFYSAAFIQNHSQDTRQNIEKLLALLQQRIASA